MDFTFEVGSHVGTGEQYGYSKVSGFDGCTFQSQIGKLYSYYSGVYDTIDITIPKIFNSLDTLFTDSCKMSSINLTSYWSRDYNYKRSQQWSSGVHFLGFKKIINNKIFRVV
jgi:hypothetical protein